MKPSHLKHRMSKLRLGIMASTMLSTLNLGYAEFALAQAQTEEAEAEALEEVIVTGSRIRRQDFEANSPIITVDESTFEETSTIGLDTILNQLPQFIPGANGAGGVQQNTTGGSQFAAGGIEASAFATPGTSSVNLRGLGSGRNLVLIDGRRGMPVNASMTVDLNSIPSTALERIEVVSGGASATYGADAIAGAVNFILKDNYEGLAIQTNYGMTELGDAEEYRVSGLFGANSADGRGNVMLGIEHSQRGEGDYAERDWWLEDRRNPAVGGNEFFFGDTYVSGIFNPGNPGQQGVINSLFPNAPPGSVPATANFYVNRTPNGTGTTYTGTEFFGGAPGAAGSYKYMGPLDVGGFPFRKKGPDGRLSQNQVENFVSVPLERYSLFARGHYDLTDNVTVFSDLTFARSLTQTASQYSPAVPSWNATVPHGTGIYAASFANPATAVTGYNPTTGAAIYNPNAPTSPRYVSGGSLGLNCPALGGCTNSQAFPMPAEINALLDTRANPNAPVDVSRVLDFMGPRTTDNATMTYQFIVGLEGELSNTWAWDVSLSHGESEVQTQLNNFGSLERYKAIASAPNYGVAFVQTGNQPSGFGAGTASCTSGLPLFREFEVSADCIDAITVNLSQHGLMEQNAFDANITGDILEMPAGTLQFALGTSFRKNEYSFKSADNNQPSNFTAGVIGLFPNNETIGSIGVKEVYGELLVPLISDGPNGIREFSLEIGGRYSDYYDTSGGVDTAKFLADWLILDWMRFRGGMQKATRAPNISELFTGRSQSIFTAGSSHGDVCSQNNYTSTLGVAQGARVNPDGSVQVSPSSAQQAAQTLALCQQLMGSGAAAVYYGNAVASQPNPGGGGQVYVTGNPNVEPETADTLTAGLVMTSPFTDSVVLSGLTASIDWFQIEVEDMVAQYSATTITERCFSVTENPGGGLDNQFCQLIRRNPADGSPLSLDVTYTNESRAKLSGIDFQVNWTTQFEDIGVGIPGGLGINVLATKPLDIITQRSATTPEVDWVGYQGGAECPSGVSCTGYGYQLFTTFNYFNGPFNASLRWQRYPSIEAGARATNPNSTAIGIPDAYDVFALTGAYAYNENITVQLGVENLFDEEPPLQGGNPAAIPFATPATRTAGGIYDPLGRRYFMSVNMNF